MYANNRLGEQPKAMFRSAGGSIYEFSHPFLAGQVDFPSGAGVLNSPVNTVNVSRNLRLNDTFFNAQPLQDNAIMEVLVDGSTITITNHVMAGRATLQVLPTTGLVKDGDLTAIAPFIMCEKDNVGGVLIRRRFTSAGTLTRAFYGVTFSNFPHDIDMGNGIPVYPIVMLYSGWIEGLLRDFEQTSKSLWAVGNQRGFIGSFIPFDIVSGDSSGVQASVDGRDEDGQFNNAPDGVARTDSSAMGGLYSDLEVAEESEGSPAGSSSTGAPPGP